MAYEQSFNTGLAELDVVKAELEHVEPALPDLFEREDLFFSWIPKRTVSVSGKSMRLPLKMWPGGMSGHFSPLGLGDLGRGSGPFFDEATVAPVHTRHAIEWELKAEWATDERRKAIVNAVRETVAEAMGEYRRFLNSLAMTAGDGVLAVVSGAPENIGPNTTLRYTCDSEYGVRLLRYGHNIEASTSSYVARTAANGSAFSATNVAQITGIDYANKTFDLAYDAQYDIADTDYILPEGLALGSAPTSFYGVRYHHDSASTGTWLGLNRATYPQIRANSVNAAGSLALAHARLAMNKIGERLGQNKKQKAVAWMHPCQKAAYEELGQLVQMITRSGQANQNLDLYFNVQQLAGAPIKEEYSWSKERIDFVVPSVWGRAEMAPIQWFKTEGRRIYNLYGASGGIAPAFVSYLVSSFQYFVENPAACSYVYGLTVPSGY